MKITEDFVREHLPEIKTEYNKFDRGRLLLIAGSYGMAGAAILAARAALRTGVGYLNLAVPRDIYELMTVAVPECVVTVYDSPEDLLPAIGKANALAIGPGLCETAGAYLEFVLKHCEKPLLIDATGLRMLSETGGRVPGFITGDETTTPSPGFMPRENLVLTPHEGEMGRLLGISSAAVRENREEAVKKAQALYGGTVLLKGAGTLVYDGKELLQNTTGNPGMAVAGSGDVLTGIIGALLAAGASPRDAAAMGAFIHGKSGDLAALRLGTRSCRPEDFIAEIPAVLKAVEAFPGREGGKDA